MGWKTVAICDHCWRKEEPGRVPIRLKQPDGERCYACGSETLSGIYVRRLVDRPIQLRREPVKPTPEERLLRAIFGGGFGGGKNGGH
jgi:hypothetical protein